MILNVATVVRATGAEVVRVTSRGEVIPGTLTVAHLQVSFTSVTIDSRTVTPGALFVALAGERVDGHQYVGQAVRAGSRGCIVSRLPEPTELAAMRPAIGDTYFFLLPDPLEGLQDLARFWRGGHDVEVVGITGSIGKTTAKEIIAATLSAQWPVLKSAANLNTEIGLPLTLLELQPAQRVAVLEMGMYDVGDIALLARIAAPEIGVVTNVAPVHLERLGTVERIARAKSELVAALPVNGLAVLNGDDPWTRAMAKASGVAPAVLVGTGLECDYRALDVTARGLDGLSFSLQAEGSLLSFDTQVPGAHTLHAFLAAAAVGRALGMGWGEIREAFHLVRLDERQRLVEGPESMLIIDDSYNAAPPSMGAALELLAAAPGRKIAVLGDMLELGANEEEAHRQVGELAARVADWLVVRGDRSSWIAEEAVRHGFSPDRVFRADTNAGAVETVREIVGCGAHPGQEPPTRTMQGAKSGRETAARWSVLVKGSRGMRMEEVVQGLRGDL